MAMEFHKNEVKKDWEQTCKECEDAKNYPYDHSQWWGIKETELQE